MSIIACTMRGYPQDAKSLIEKEMNRHKGVH